MDETYLEQLQKEFRSYSAELKNLKQKLLKTNSSSEQSKIIRKIDTIASKMEKNQKQATKVKYSMQKDMKKKKNS